MRIFKAKYTIRPKIKKRDINIMTTNQLKHIGIAMFVSWGRSRTQVPLM